MFENAAGFLRVRGAVRDAYDDELDGSDYYSSSAGNKKGQGGNTKVGGREGGRGPTVCVCVSVSCLWVASS